jgi:hypothetical protein
VGGVVEVEEVVVVFEDDVEDVVVDDGMEEVVLDGLLGF